MWLGCGLLPDDLFIDVACLHLYSWSLFVDINKGLNEGLALLGCQPHCKSWRVLFLFQMCIANQRRSNNSADVRMQDVELQIVVSIFGLPSLILLLSWKSPKHPGTGLARGCLGSNGKVQQRANSYAQGASRTEQKLNVYSKNRDKTKLTKGKIGNEKTFDPFWLGVGSSFFFRKDSHGFSLFGSFSCCIQNFVYLSVTKGLPFLP